MNIDEIGLILEQAHPNNELIQESPFFNNPIFENERPWTQITDFNTLEIPHNNENDLSVLVRHLGIEILAYYVPCTFHTPDLPWGIYLRKRGIDVVRTELLQMAQQDGIDFTHNPDIFVPLARKILNYHELGHCAVEMACHRLDMDLNRPLETYRTHNNQVDPTIHLQEESICNVNVAQKMSNANIRYSRNQCTLDVDNIQNTLPQIRNPAVIELPCKDYVYRFMEHQPDGYNAFRQWINQNNSYLLQTLNISDDAHALLPCVTEFTEFRKLDKLTNFVPVYIDDAQY